MIVDFLQTVTLKGSLSGASAEKLPPYMAPYFCTTNMSRGTVQGPWSKHSSTYLQKRTLELAWCLLRGKDASSRLADAVAEALKLYGSEKTKADWDSLSSIKE